MNWRLSARLMEMYKMLPHLLAAPVARRVLTWVIQSGGVSHD